MLPYYWAESLTVNKDGNEAPNCPLVADLSIGLTSSSRTEAKLKIQSTH